MRAAMLPLLRSPDDLHGSSLALLQSDRALGDDIITGEAWAGGHGPYPIRDGILDLLYGSSFPVSPAQRSNFLWPTSQYYEQVWRVRSLSLLAGATFPVADELALLHRWLTPERGGVYVDVGTSHGLYARAVAHTLEREGANGTVFALDIAPAMLRRAGELIAQKGYRSIGLVRARAQALPLADGSADGVMNGGTFNEMGEQETALREVRRVLKPGGAFFCMSLIAGATTAGRGVQQLLTTTSGIVFPTRDATNVVFADADLAITDQEQRGVVLLTRAVPDKASK